MESVGTIAVFGMRRSVRPGTEPIACSISVAAFSMASRSVPSTLITTCAVSPLKRLADAVAEERHGLAVDLGEGLERVPDLVLGLLLGLGADRLQLDVELAAVGAPGVLAGFGAADLMADRLR